ATQKTPMVQLFEKELKEHLEAFHAFSNRYQLIESAAYIERLQRDFMFWATNEEVQIGLRALIDLVDSEMKKRLFFSVDAGFDKYYVSTLNVLLEEIRSPFGALVDAAFPNAKMDMIEAGNCLAVGRNNAAVYHLICAAEIGLRVLAWD